MFCWLYEGFRGFNLLVSPWICSEFWCFRFTELRLKGFHGLLTILKGEGLFPAVLPGTGLWSFGEFGLGVRVWGFRMSVA